MKKEMLATAKVLMLVLASMGLAATGAVAGVVNIPLDNAIDIHRQKLGDNSTMPDQATKGLQKSLDHLEDNQGRWLANHSDQLAARLNQTADAVLEPS